MRNVAGQFSPQQAILYREKQNLTKQKRLLLGKDIEKPRKEGDDPMENDRERQRCLTGMVREDPCLSLVLWRLVGRNFQRRMEAMPVSHS